MVQMWIRRNFNVLLASHKVNGKETHGIRCFVHSNPYKGISYVTSYVFQGFFIADRQTMFSMCSLVWNMLLAVLFQKGLKFRHLDFKPGHVRGHHPIAHILEEFVS
jgi:hypothetical protein